jgi:flagellin
MQEVQDMLNRMVTLATQSANGTYDDETDRANLQKEVVALKSEIDRIAESSNFNGIQLLDGSLDDTVQYTSGTDAVTAGALTAVLDGQLGNDATAGVFTLDLSKFVGTANATTQTLTLFGETTANLGKAKGEEVTAADWAEAIKDKFDGNTVFGTTYGDDFDLTVDYDGNNIVTISMNTAPTTAWNKNATVTITGVDSNQAYGDLEIKTEPVDSSASRKYAQATVDLSKAGIADGSTLTIGDSTYVFAVGGNSAYKDYKNAIDLTDITQDQIAAGGKDTYGKITGRVTMAAADNKNFMVTAGSAVDATNGATTIKLTELEGGVDTTDYKLAKQNATATTASGDWTGLVKFGKVDTQKTGSALKLQIGDTSDDFNQLNVSINNIHTENLGIDDIDISTQEGATTAIDKIKAAINSVSSTRGDLGAVQNRLEHTANNLSVMTENIQDAESTIRDTDIAEEMMSYTKNSILVQSAQAMLAQANTVPQGVLQLLQ